MSFNLIPNFNRSIVAGYAIQKWLSLKILQIGFIADKKNDSKLLREERCISDYSCSSLLKEIKAGLQEGNLGKELKHRLQEY